MTKFEKTKVWIKDHKEELVATGVVAGIAAIYVGLIALAVKQHNQVTEEEAKVMHEVTEAFDRGASVLLNPAGYWIIEKNQAV